MDIKIKFDRLLLYLAKKLQGKRLSWNQGKDPRFVFIYFLPKKLSYTIDVVYDFENQKIIKISETGKVVFDKQFDKLLCIDDYDNFVLELFA